MKRTTWLALAVAAAIPLFSYAQAPAAGAANVSPNAAEVVKLAGSGVGEDVVLAYVQNAQGPFDLTADTVLYLRDVGVSQPVITAMLNHDAAFHSQGPPPQYAPSDASAPQAPPPTSAQAPEAPPPQAEPAPADYVGNPPPDVNYFYNDLAPYGTWVSSPAVGWCWQPSVVVVNRGWRPYCDSGHWVYTDAGWFWQSDYSWGWAPFHYGRWYADPACGWVWVPGRVWAPAWVTWRTVGTTCGWAPLPPGANFVAGIGWSWHGAAVAANFSFGLGVNAFAFVPFGNFCAVNVVHYCLPPAQATVVFKQTVVVNNFTVVNNTVVNHGIAVNRIAAASHVPIPRATVREGRPGVGKPLGAGGAVVYKAPLKAPAKPTHMTAQRIDAGHPYIQHTSAAMPKYEQRSSFTGAGQSSTFSHGTSPGAKGEQKSTFGGNTPTTTWQHPQTGSSTPGAAGNGAAKYHAGTPQAYQGQSAQKPAAGAEPYSATKSYQGQTWNQESHSTSGSKLPGTVTASPEPTFGHAPSGAAGTPHKGAGSSYSGASQGQGGGGAQAWHFYNPKTMEQSSQVRSLYQPPKANSGVPATPGGQPGGKKNQ